MYDTIDGGATVKQQTPALSQATIDEIYRKASNGMTLANATPEKQAIYDSYTNKMMAEIQNKANQGVALSAPTDFKQQQYNQFLGMNQTQPVGQGAPQGDPNQMGAQSFDQSGMMDAMNRFLQQSSDAQFAHQQALLGQARDNEIANLQKAYMDAVEQGNMSLREAEQAFQKQAEAINQQSYQDSERTNLVAEGRGIGNSQQMLGLMAGDNARKNGLINENMTTRDKRVSDIKDRVSNLKKQMDMDVVGANRNYDYGIAGARAQADMSLADKQFQMQFSDYEAMRNHNYDLAKMDKQQVHVLEQLATSFGYDLQKMDKQQIQQLDLMAKGHGYDLEKMGVQQTYDLAKMDKQQVQVLEQMAKQFGYDINKMDKQQVNQLALMAKQFGYDMSMQASKQQHDFAMLDAQGNWDMKKLSVQLSNSLKLQGAQAKDAQALLEKELTKKQALYEQEREWELSKFKKGTPEYDIELGKIKQKQEAEMRSYVNQLVNQGSANAIFKNGIVEKPVEPGSYKWLGIFDTGFQSEIEKKKYQENQAMYKAQQEMLKKYGINTK